MLRGTRFLRSGPTDDAARRERVVASARAFLATSSLIAISLDPTEIGRSAPLTYTLLSVYATYALAILFFLRGPRAARAAVLLHAVDVASAAALTYFTTGPTSPFYLFFLFTLLAAAFRWGLRETIVTAAVAIGINVAEGVAAHGTDPNLVLNRSIVRGAYLLMMTGLLGYLGEREKQWRNELLAVATVMKHPNVAAGMGGTLRAVGGELLQLFEARVVLFVTRESVDAPTYVWTVRRAAGVVEARLQRRDAAAVDRYFFDAPRMWRASTGREGPSVQTVSDDGLRLRPAAAAIPAAFEEAHPASSVLAVGFRLADAGSGRVFVLDASMPRSARPLQFLATLVDHVGPAIHNVYLLRRLRARAGAAERARVARELHDGAIQALIGLEMEIHALRHGAARETGIDAELAYIQDLVHQQALELRELMQQLRPLDLESTDRLPDLLGAMVDKFRRDTGIAAQFVSTVDRIVIPPRAALELARIVQEALVNVRRHSGASAVLVRLEGQGERWVLSIDDDGRGFDFAGRLSNHELSERRLGPTVICERARAIGAGVAIESRPGQGARLEISMTGAVHA
jgi:signal transduction histidine kinase